MSAKLLGNLVWWTALVLAGLELYSGTVFFWPSDSVGFGGAFFFYELAVMLIAVVIAIIGRTAFYVLARK